MSAIVQASQLRAIDFGTQVIKAGQTPPASGASATLFTVTGGAILVTSLTGRVTTVMSGTTGKISLGSTPSLAGSTLEVAGIATATVVGGAEVGTKLSVGIVSGSLGGLLVTSVLFGGNAPYVSPAAFVVSAGLITVTTSTLTMTGAIDWYLSYVQLDTGATVS